MKNPRGERKVVSADPVPVAMDLYNYRSMPVAVMSRFGLAVRR